MTCKCSNTGILNTFKFCPYCGSKFVKPLKRYPYEGQSFAKGYAINTQDYRAPKQGEYYLSGATPMAYKAPIDFTESYFIAEIVLTD